MQIYMKNCNNKWKERNIHFINCYFSKWSGQTGENNKVNDGNTRECKHLDEHEETNLRLNWN